MTEQAPKGRVRCECVGRDPECEQCGGVGHIQRVIIPHGKRPGLEQGIPGALAEEDWQDAREALEAPMRAGHTYHCAARIVWGDGECTCDLGRRR